MFLTSAGKAVATRLRAATLNLQTQPLSADDPRLDPQPTPAQREIAFKGRRISKLRFAFFGIAALFAAAFWDGYRKTPSGPAVGSALNGASPPSAPASPSARGLRVGIYNIQGGTGLDNHRDLHRIAGVIKDCDLVGLNEVHGRSIAEPRDQAHLLGDELKTGWLFAPTERRWWHDDFGNGILCNRPVLSWQRIPIAGANSRSNRNALFVRVPLADRTLHVLITHLDRHEDHRPELKCVTEFFLSLAEPAILMGDLNDTAKDPTINQLSRTAGVLDVIAEIPNLKHNDSDWIFARGLRCQKAGTHEAGPSDHPFFWADLQLEP